MNIHTTIDYASSPVCSQRNAATDVLGNTQTSPQHPPQRFLNVLKKTTPPSLRAVRTFSPLISVNSDCDTYRVWQGAGGSEGAGVCRKENFSIWNNNSVWRLGTPVPLDNPDSTYMLTPQSIPALHAEDIAGNETAAPALVTRLYVNAFYWGAYEDYGRKRPLAGYDGLGTGDALQIMVIKHTPYPPYQSKDHEYTLTIANNMACNTAGLYALNGEDPQFTYFYDANMGEFRGHHT